MTITHLQVGQLPAVRLSTPDGAEATITLFGAHLVSWTGSDRCERLFLSERSSLDGQRAIRGGVPVIFPQFAEHGTGMRHGFARLSSWRVAGHGIDGEGAFVAFELTDLDLAPGHAAAWPHAFHLTLRITLHANALSMTLDVQNTGISAFAFSAALHTYHRVQDLASVRIEGIEPDTLSISGKIDTIYADHVGNALLETGTERRVLAQTGFPDIVVWNPGASDAAALPDMADGDDRHFVCIEPLMLGPRMLDPGEAWCGEGRMTVVS